MRLSLFLFAFSTNIIMKELKIRGGIIMKYHYAVFAVLWIFTLVVVIREFKEDLLSFKEDEGA